MYYLPEESTSSLSLGNSEHPPPQMNPPALEVVDLAIDTLLDDIASKNTTGSYDFSSYVLRCFIRG